MAKKLSKIEEEISNKSNGFLNYLKFILGDELFEFLIELNQTGDLYLFSGIIRNFFLKIRKIRDVDLIINTDNEISEIISRYTYRINSYGGYKIFINNKVIDLWHLKNTWALLHSQKVFDYEAENYIPKTAFFNFSSIIFSFKEEKFIFTKDFVKFLRDKKIDYVFKPNANYALCVVNSFYYQKKLELKLSNRLKDYLIELDKNYSSEYEKVQLKHFGRIIFDSHEMNEKIEELKNEQNIRFSNKFKDKAD